MAGLASAVIGASGAGVAAAGASPAAVGGTGAVPPGGVGCAAFSLETSASSSFKRASCGLSCSSSCAVVSGDASAAGAGVCCACAKPMERTTRASNKTETLVRAIVIAFLIVAQSLHAESAAE